jgi:hypothetical protein
LISREEFNRVQAKLALNKKQAARNNKGYRYLLRALVSCGACQSACIARTTNGGLRYYICRCQAQPIYSQHDQRCHARCIPAQQLDGLVWEDLCRLIMHPHYIQDALERVRRGDWLPQHLQARRQALRKAEASLSQQLERLTNAYLTAIIPLPEYQRRRRELEQKGEALAAQAKELEAQVDRQAELGQPSSSIEEFCHRIQRGSAEATFEQKRTIVELLIDRVVVTDGEIEIRYVVPTHPSSEKVRFCHLRKDYLDHVVQVLTAADPDRVLPTEIELVAHTHAAEGGVRRLETVKRDGSRLAMALQRLAEERFGGGDIPCPTEMRLHRAAAFVHGTVQIHPAAGHLDIRFIAAPGAPDRSCEMPPGFGQLGRIPNHPAQNCARRDGHAHLAHELSQIAVAQLEPQIPN